MTNYNDAHNNGKAVLMVERGALGIATELRTPPVKSKGSTEYIDETTGEIVTVGKIDDASAILEARRLRFKLQDASRHILYGYHPEPIINQKGYQVHHRTCTCNRFRLSTTAQVLKSKQHNKAVFGGLMNCANAKTCPVCAATINERKSNEIRTAFNQLDALGLKAHMLTFTAPHNASDSIADLNAKISEALAAFWRGKPAEKFKKRYGIVGRIRSFEVRYGSNGWHPHFHQILFTKYSMPQTKRGDKGRPLPVDQQHEDWRWILERWQNMCVNAGLSCPNEYGMDLQDGKQAGEYVNKYGSDEEILSTKTGKRLTWDMADEMTKGNAKVGKTKSLTPWDLLAISVDGETEEERNKASQLFLFYARAMHGVALVKWMRGTRDLFGLGKELSDDELIKEEQDKCDLLCHITPVEWKAIITNGHRCMVLELAENGGANAVAMFLHSLDSSLPFKTFMKRFSKRTDKHNLEHDADESRVVTHYSVDGGHSATIKAKGVGLYRAPQKASKVPTGSGEYQYELLADIEDDFVSEIKQVIRNKPRK